MRAKLDRDGLWIVSEGQRWWTVSFRGKTAIYNEKLTPVKADGALGKRILRAVAEAQCRGRHPAGYRHKV